MAKIWLREFCTACAWGTNFAVGRHDDPTRFLSDKCPQCGRPTDAIEITPQSQPATERA